MASRLTPGKLECGAAEARTQPRWRRRAKKIQNFDQKSSFRCSRQDESGSDLNILSLWKIPKSPRSDPPRLTRGLVITVQGQRLMSLAAGTHQQK